jgi:hypothetical protein
MKLCTYFLSLSESVCRKKSQESLDNSNFYNFSKKGRGHFQKSRKCLNGLNSFKIMLKVLIMSAASSIPWTVPASSDQLGCSLPLQLKEPHSCCSIWGGGYFSVLDALAHPICLLLGWGRTGGWPVHPDDFLQKNVSNKSYPVCRGVVIHEHSLVANLL